MNTILSVPFTLDWDDIKAQLAIKPGTRAEESLETILDEVQKIARPKAVYRITYIDALGDDSVSVEGTVLHSRVFRHNLEGVHRIFPFVATCGIEVEDTPIDRDDFLQEYWLRIISLSLVRIAMDTLRQTLQEQYLLENLSVMNPGSAEADVWPIEEQQALFSLLGGAQAVEQAIGVRLLPSWFMTPDMSVSGILFPSEVTYVNCQLCQREGCPSRKAEFDAALWQNIQSKRQ
jgi:hypothetical protein